MYIPYFLKILSFIFELLVYLYILYISKLYISHMTIEYQKVDSFTKYLKSTKDEKIFPD